MNWIKRVVAVVFLLFFTASIGYGEEMESVELSGRGSEIPMAVTVGDEVIYLAVREPAGVVFYSRTWNEIAYVALPKDFVPNEMILIEDRLWILDKQESVIVEVDTKGLQVARIITAWEAIELVSIFEANGFVLVMDHHGYLYQVTEQLDTLGWLTGLSRYQACIFDGYLLYLGGQIHAGESGVLVKTQENLEKGEWKLSDDPDAPNMEDTIEKIRLLNDGYLYVVYRNTGIVKYDGDGNQYNRIYQEENEEQIFMDIAFDSWSQAYYLLDQSQGVFVLNWPEQRMIFSEYEEEVEPEEEVFHDPEWDEWLAWLDWDDSEGWEDWIIIGDDQDEGQIQPRLSQQTWKGCTTAVLRLGQLFGYYRPDDQRIRMVLHDHDSVRLKLQIYISDLIAAQDQDYETIEVDWNGQVYEFSLLKWSLIMKDLDEIESQYIEIQIEEGTVIIEACYVERLDEKTKRVHREKLE